MGDRFAVALNGYGLIDDGRREVLPWGDVVEAAELAEETGYQAVFAPEIGAREAFSALVALADRTERIWLATGVAPLGSRDPRRMAMEAATLHELSRGRAVLGLGSRKPIGATREEIRAIRELLAGEEPKVETEEGTLSVGALDLAPTRIPVYLAALGPRMTELAGEVADGVILNWATPERVHRARGEIERGAAREGRDPAGVTVCVYIRACVGQAEEHALTALQEAAAEYAGMPYYLRQFEAMGLGGEARRAAAADGPGRVPPALVDAVCVRGSRSEAMSRLRAYHEAGADLVVVYPVPAMDASTSIAGTILGVAPSPAVEH